MKALQVMSPNNLKLIEKEKPTIENDNDVIIKVMAAGVCGSDVSILKGHNPIATYPRILGHEVTGQIVEIGANVQNIKIGDHVIISQTESCGKCYACLHGRSNVCADLKVRGVNIDGGYQQYFKLPATSVYKLDLNLDYKKAVLIEPYTISFHALSRGRVVKDDLLLINGAGALGFSLLTVAKSLKCKIISIDIDQEKLDSALNAGADYIFNGNDPKLKEKILSVSDGYGPTVCIDSVCNTKSVEFLLDIVGNAGRIVTMGFDERPSNIAQLLITKKEIDIIGSRLQYENFENVIDLFETHQIDPSSMISHILDFREVDKILNTINSKNYKKIILDFDI
ncbi:MAG: alcohol dehydrogenase catalytic domain-containing protein [Pleomorphochaeta sp.]